MGYAEDISGLDSISVRDIVRLSAPYAGHEKRKSVWWREKSSVIEHDPLCLQAVTHGESHLQDYTRAFHHIPFIDISEAKVAIVDYGQDQGLAAVHLITYLERMGIKESLKRIIVVGQQGAAQQRTLLHLRKAAGSEVTVTSVRRFRGDMIPADDEIGIVIHLIPNPLDMAGLDPAKLDDGDSDGCNRHFFVFLSHQFAGDCRLETFCREYRQRLLSCGIKFEFSSGEPADADEVDDRYVYSCLTKGFELAVRRDGMVIKPFACHKPLVARASYLPGFMLDSGYKILNRDSYFRIISGCVLSDSSNEEKNNIIGVVEIIITRGNPTLCSPFIEKTLSRLTGICKRAVNDNDDYIFTVNNEERYLKYRYAVERICLTIARIQRIIIEVVKSGKTDLSQESLSMLIVEGEYPCGALAIEDFISLYNTAFGLAGFQTDKFPDIDLTVINSTKPSSRLHLGHKVIESVRELSGDSKFDLVIDVRDGIEISDCRFLDSLAKNDCCFVVEPAKDCDLASYSDKCRNDDGLDLSSLCHAGDYGSDAWKYAARLLLRKTVLSDSIMTLLTNISAKKNVIQLGMSVDDKLRLVALLSSLYKGVGLLIVRDNDSMERVVSGLGHLGIDSVIRLSSLENESIRSKYRKLSDGDCNIAVIESCLLHDYTLSKAVRKLVEGGNRVSFVAVDGAESASEWSGHFDVNMTTLNKRILSQLVGEECRVIAFSDDSNPDVTADIENVLSSGDGRWVVEGLVTEDVAAVEAAEYSLIEEKRMLFQILYKADLGCFYGNERQYKPEDTVIINGLAGEYRQAAEGAELITLMTYQEQYLGLIMRAVYRLICIGLVDDFTHDREAKCLRLLSIKKSVGHSYVALWQYFSRYYDDDDAEDMAESASIMRGNDEFQKCLGCLLDFVYRKLGVR